MGTEQAIGLPLMFNATINVDPSMCPGTDTQMKLQMALNFTANSARAEQVCEKERMALVWCELKKN
jgi:hypothetical protein